MRGLVLYGGVLFGQSLTEIMQKEADAMKIQRHIVGFLSAPPQAKSPLTALCLGILKQKLVFWTPKRHHWSTAGSSPPDATIRDWMTGSSQLWPLSLFQWARGTL